MKHDVRVDDAEIGLRDGASVGYLLRKHHYPLRTVARMLVRPLGGAVVSLARRDRRAGVLLRGDVSRARPRLSPGKSLEELPVTVEPAVERKALDGSCTGGG